MNIIIKNKMFKIHWKREYIVRSKISVEIILILNRVTRVLCLYRTSALGLKASETSLIYSSKAWHYRSSGKYLGLSSSCWYRLDKLVEILKTLKITWLSVQVLVEKGNIFVYESRWKTPTEPIVISNLQVSSLYHSRTL